MPSQDRGRPLPKFGEWDASNPASAEGFSVIFKKARDEKRTSAAAAAAGNFKSPRRNDAVYKKSGSSNLSSPRKWLCCG